MRKTILCLVLLLPFGVNAMVVSDPTSYTYYVEQIQNMQKQLETMQKTVSTMENVKETLETGDIESMARVQRQLEGSYNRAAKAGMEIDAIAGRLGGTTAPLEEPDPNSQKGAMQWEGKRYLDNRFKAPGETGKTQANARERAKARDYTYEQALLAADQSLRTINQRFDLQKDLAAQIDSTENVKDAQDLSNRILLELVNIQTEMLAAINYLSATMAAREYQGLSNRKERTKKQSGNFDSWINETTGGKVTTFDKIENNSSQW